MIFYYLIWREAAFKQAKEEGLEVTTKSDTDAYLEALLELTGEGVKAILDMLQVVARTLGASFG